MAKRRKMGLREFAKVWKALPQSDQRFFSTLIIIVQALGYEKLHYHGTPRPLLRTLRKLDRNTVFSVRALAYCPECPAACRRLGKV